jgi:hypothetical protein
MDYNGDYTVTLELPDCAWEPDETGEPNDPIGAVKSFIAQASQTELWNYRVKENSGERRTFVVDMAGGPSVRCVDKETA